METFVLDCESQYQSTDQLPTPSVAAALLPVFHSVYHLRSSESPQALGLWLELPSSTLLSVVALIFLSLLFLDFLPVLVASFLFLQCATSTALPIHAFALHRQTLE